MFAKDLEKFKSDLQIEAFKSNYTFEKLHAERAEVIKKLYVLMIETYRKLGRIMIPDNSDLYMKKLRTEETIVTAGDKFQELIDYFHFNRIFLSESLSDRISKLIEKLNKAWLEFCQDEKKGEITDMAWNTLDCEVKEIQIKLENDFRLLLGIKND